MFSRIRVILVLALIAAFVAGMLFFAFFPGVKKRWKRQCARRLRLLLRIEVCASLHESPRQPFLIAANHISYVDVLILEEIFQPTFITSREVREDPFLGRICRLSDCLFVERRHRQAVAEDIAQLRQRVDRGETLCLFPEGTTGEGRRLLPLRSSLLQVAVEANLAILPVRLVYCESSPSRIPYLKEHRFISHFLRLIRGPGARVHVKVGDVLSPGPGRKIQCEKLAIQLEKLGLPFAPNRILTKSHQPKRDNCSLPV